MNTLPVTDVDLISRVLVDDDRNAFAELVRRHQGSVRAFLRRLSGGDFALADDLAQESFLTAYRILPKFGGQSRFETWLLGIAYNKFRDHRRTRRRREPWADDSARESSGDREAADPDCWRHSSDLKEDLSNALSGLPATERAAVHLCYRQGMTREEAAKVLGCPLGTLKTNLLRAKEKLRTALRAWEPG